MFKKIDAWLESCTEFLTPLFNVIIPLLERLRPTRDKIVIKFFKYFRKYLKVTAAEKEKIKTGNIVKIFRVYSIAAVLFRIIFSVIATGGGILVAWRVSVVNLPLVYLLCRGYRISYLLLILTNTFFSILMLIREPTSILFIGVWWFIACSIYFFAFRYENARYEMADKGEIPPLVRHVKKDIVGVAIIIILSLFLSQMVRYVAMPNLSPKKEVLRDNHQLNRNAGIISRSLYGYKEFCQKQGYELKIYPTLFAKRYANEIASVEKELSERDSSLQEYYDNAKRIYGEKLENSIKNELDILRRQAIVELVALNKNIRPSQVKWTSEMDNYISMVEACVLFDEISENTLPLAGKDLNTLPSSN